MTWSSTRSCRARALEHQAIGLAVLLLDVRVRRPEHDVDHLGMGRDDGRQGLDDVLDPLVRRQQAEGEQHLVAFDAEAMLALARGGHLRNAVRNDVDLRRGHAVASPPARSAPVRAHHHQALRELARSPRSRAAAAGSGRSGWCAASSRSACAARAATATDGCRLCRRRCRTRAARDTRSTPLTFR